MTASMIMNGLDGPGYESELDLDSDVTKLHIGDGPVRGHKREPSKLRLDSEDLEEQKTEQKPEQKPESSKPKDTTPPRGGHPRQDTQHSPRHLPNMPSPLKRAHGASTPTRSPLHRAETMPARLTSDEDFEYTDERAREVIHGRLVQGHIVPDDYPSPTQSAMSSSMILDHQEEDPMAMSRASSFFNPEPHALGGTGDAAATSDEEEEGFNNPSLEQMITLVGDVRNRTVFIIDDMIDKAGSWIAAAETVVKRGGAKKVYCIATHGLFGGDSLEEMQACDCIDTIVVTNSFPIPAEKIREIKKLVVLDLSGLLSEAIRRNHYGESTFYKPFSLSF